MATILLVDDDIQITTALRRCLHEHTVLIAHTVKEGRAVFRRNKDEIDLVLLDGYMGKLDPTPTTISLAIDIRDEGFTKPIIAISSDADMRAQQMEYGCSSGVDKLFADRLIAHIEELLAAQ